MAGVDLYIVFCDVTILWRFLFRVLNTLSFSILILFFVEIQCDPT